MNSLMTLWQTSTFLAHKLLSTSTLTLVLYSSSILCNFIFGDDVYKIPSWFYLQITFNSIYFWNKKKVNVNDIFNIVIKVYVKIIFLFYVQ